MKLNLETSDMIPSFASQGISLDMGLCYGFWGENGIGKTRYLNFLKQQQIVKGSRLHNPSCAFLDQTPHENYYHCSVKELADELFSLTHLPWQAKAKDLFLSILEEVEQKKMLVESYKSLSGGQRQVLKWAFLLVQKFDFVFLDEPFQQLDENKRHWASDQIVNLKKHGKGIGLVDHNWPRLNLLCDQIFEVKKNIHEKLIFLPMNKSKQVLSTDE